MKILVTGAAGFIGYHLCERLIKEGHDVVGLDNINDYYDINLKYARLEQLGIERENAERFEESAISKKYYASFLFIRLNLEDRANLPIVFETHQFDVVVNLAAQAGVRYSLESPETYIDSNIVGFLNILECCRHNKIKHLLYASSSSVYGKNHKTPFSVEDNVDHPISLYAATKRTNELMAYTYSHLYDLPTTGLRFFTVYGPWGRPDMAPFLFTKAICEGKPIKIFNNGNMSRDFTFIDDIIEGISLVLKVPPKTELDEWNYRLFNIGNGSPHLLMDFVSAIEKAVGNTANKEYLPMQLGDVPTTWADTEKLNLLGYRSLTGIEEGVSHFVKWYKDFYSAPHPNNKGFSKTEKHSI